MYRVKEIFASLQGEGYWTGRRAVFLRFSGCNLWSGREEDRAKGKAPCAQWCDTDFLGGDAYQSAPDLAEAVERTWGDGLPHRFVVLRGGEPALQVDAALTGELHDRGFYVAIETNGTRPIPPGVDWVTCSPKTPILHVRAADELKLVHPQQLQPHDLDWFAATHRFLQPLDDDRQPDNIRATVAYILGHPEWRLSLQTHKLIGLP